MGHQLGAGVQRYLASIASDHIATAPALGGMGTAPDFAKFSGGVTGHVNRRGWIVLSSVASSDSSLCVDFFEHPSGGFGYEQFRSDPEDMGGWTPISGYSAAAIRQRRGKQSSTPEPQ